MKRKPPTLEKDCAKKTKLNCLICFEHFTEFEMGQKCRQCKQIPWCRGCMIDYMVHTADKAHQLQKKPQLECPHCRMKPWFKPDFYIEAKGRAFTVEKTFEFYYGGARPYYLHMIHDDTQAVGYACLEHCEEYEENTHSFHIKDIKKLELYGHGFNELTKALEASPGSICTFVDGAEDDMQHFKSLLDDHEIGYKPCDEYIAIECLEDFIPLKKNIF